MARAGVASASAHPDSIRGLAQSIAKPAYRRLLTAEPLLRRAVPVLIIAFLATICVGALVQVLDHRRQTLTDEILSLEAVADFATERLQRPLNGAAAVLEQPQAILTRVLPTWGAAAGRRFFLTNAEGTVTAESPSGGAAVGRRMVDLLGPTQPLTTFGAGAGVLEILLPDETRVLATVRMLNTPFGQLAVVQSRDAALAGWRSLTTLTVTLSATTGFVVLILGFAFHWQATRAREADLIYETVRTRIDTALNRGRCGLWDWDLARGRIFWSQSMFEILGLDTKYDLLSFGDVNALVHPDDVRLYQLAAELADATTTTIDHAFRMRHAAGHWVWLRARCELVRQPGEPGLHLIGIAVDITEQKNLVEKTFAADMRLRDAIETIPEAFVLWDAENRLVLCNSNFQELHGLADEAITVGASFESVVAAGSKPVVRNKIITGGPSVPGARTFEAQLEDGRWLHISERRTKDGVDGHLRDGRAARLLDLADEDGEVGVERHLSAPSSDEAGTLGVERPAVDEVLHGRPRRRGHRGRARGRARAPAPARRGRARRRGPGVSGTSIAPSRICSGSRGEPLAVLPDPVRVERRDLARGGGADLGEHRERDVEVVVRVRAPGQAEVVSSTNSSSENSSRATNRRASLASLNDRHVESAAPAHQNHLQDPIHLLGNAVAAN